MELCCVRVIFSCGKFEFFRLIVYGSVIIIFFVFDNLYNIMGFSLI